MTLDHSSTDALVRDLYLRRNRRFLFKSDGCWSASWRFLSVYTKGAELWLCVEYWGGGTEVKHTLLRAGRLYFVGSTDKCGYVVSLLSGMPLRGSSSTDDSQLDKNLRGVFA